MCQDHLVVNDLPDHADSFDDAVVDASIYHAAVTRISVAAASLQNIYGLN